MTETYSQLAERAKGNPAAEIALELLMFPSYEKWVGLVERSIDLIFLRMAENPKFYQERSEDELTIDVVNQLKAAGFQAEHDTMIGGHVDIKIRGKNESLWLGEAKKHKDDYGWLFKGFLQLNTRYATGSDGQTAGGMLIYCTQERVDRIMARWKKYLGESDNNLEFSDSGGLAFFTHHPHRRTGAKMTVRHVPLSLYFLPEDNAPRV